jgi:hypothetical protein
MTASAEIDGVLARYPDVSYRGWIAPAVGERPARTAARRKEARAEMLDPIVMTQFELCREFVAAHLGTEDPQGELVSSTELKKALERWHLHQGRAVYVCQGIVIFGMLSVGYTPRVITPPTACFLVSAGRLRALSLPITTDIGPSRSTLAIR